MRLSGDGKRVVLLALSTVTKLHLPSSSRFPKTSRKLGHEEGNLDLESLIETSWCHGHFLVVIQHCPIRYRKVP